MKLTIINYKFIKNKKNGKNKNNENFSKNKN